MERGDSVLDAIFEDENLEDVEMLDVEDGEIVEQGQHDINAETDKDADLVKTTDMESRNNNPSQSKGKRKKKKKKRKKGTAGPNITDINRLTLTCSCFIHIVFFNNFFSK